MLLIEIAYAIGWGVFLYEILAMVRAMLIRRRNWELLRQAARERLQDQYRGAA